MCKCPTWEWQKASEHLSPQLISVAPWHTGLVQNGKAEWSLDAGAGAVNVLSLATQEIGRECWASHRLSPSLFPDPFPPNHPYKFTLSSVSFLMEQV